MQNWSVKKGSKLFVRGLERTSFCGTEIKIVITFTKLVLNCAMPEMLGMVITMIDLYVAKLNFFST